MNGRRRDWDTADAVFVRMLATRRRVPDAHAMVKTRRGLRPPQLPPAPLRAQARPSAVRPSPAPSCGRRTPLYPGVRLSFDGNQENFDSDEAPQRTPTRAKREKRQSLRKRWQPDFGVEPELAQL